MSLLAPDHVKTQEMYIKAVEVDQWQLHDVPDRFNTKEKCYAAVHINPASFFCSCPF